MSSPKVHLQVGQVLRGGVRPRHAAERVQLWLVQQDLLYLIQIQVALVHLQDLRRGNGLNTGDETEVNTDGYRLFTQFG